MEAQSTNSLRRPQDEIERERESAFIPSLETDLRRFRAARTSGEMRAALEGAGAPLRILRERIDALNAQRLDFLRRGTASAAVAIDDKLARLRAVEQGFMLLVEDFECDLPEAERREAMARETSRAVLGPLVTARAEAARRLLAGREVLAELAADAAEYERASKAIDAERARLHRAGCDVEGLGLDLSAPLVASPRRRHPRTEEERGTVAGDFPAGLRIPGLAPRGETAPDWLYFPIS